MSPALLVADPAAGAASCAGDSRLRRQSSDVERGVRRRAERCRHLRRRDSPGSTPLHNQKKSLVFMA